MGKMKKIKIIKTKQPMKLSVKSIFLTLLVATLCLPAMAQRLEHKLYVSKPGEKIYRLPAIACTVDGTLIAVSDDRYNHGSDVGYAKPIDIMCRLSEDNGLTWKT